VTTTESTNPPNRTMIIVIGAIVVVALLAGLAVLLTGGDDESSGGVIDPSETTEPAGPVEQTRPVEITGDPLPPLTDGLPTDPGVGMALPVLDGQSFDGTPITIGGEADGTTLVVYLAHWCPACNAEVPELVELNNRDGVPEGMEVVAVSTAVDQTRANYPPSDWLADNDWPWPAMADDADSNAFVFSGGSGFPYLVILDENGEVVARESGTRSAEEIAAWIQESLASAT
jgi:thiol-disulfide isomerase/thioredoxin